MLIKLLRRRCKTHRHSLRRTIALLKLAPRITSDRRELEFVENGFGEISKRDIMTADHHHYDFQTPNLCNRKKYNIIDVQMVPRYIAIRIL